MRRVTARLRTVSSRVAADEVKRKMTTFFGGSSRKTPALPFMLSMAVEAVVLLSAAVVFAGSTSPAKPLMRRMLLFVICANICLWILSWFVNGSIEVLLAWRLHGFAISVAYIFSLRFNKLYNIAFWIFNIMCIAIAAVFGVWIWIF